MTQVQYGSSSPLTFPFIEDKTLVLQFMYDVQHILNVFVFGLQEDHNIVQIHHCCVVNVVMEDVVHHSLKCCRSVGKSKWHDMKLKMTITACKHGHFFCIISQLYLPVSTAEVQTSEELCAGQIPVCSVYH